MHFRAMRGKTLNVTKIEHFDLTLLDLLASLAVANLRLSTQNLPLCDPDNKEFIYQCDYSMIFVQFASCFRNFSCLIFEFADAVNNYVYT